MNPITVLIVFFVTLAIFIGLFLLCRAIVHWYFKIDEAMRRLHSIELHLADLVQLGGKTPHQMESL